MVKLILTVGCPGTGKTTWAKEFVKNNPTFTRVSRDDYRWMLFNTQMGNPQQEELITKIVNDTVINCLKNGKNVILDATNVKRKYINAAIDMFNQYADIEFKVFHELDINELIERNSKRPVNEQVPKFVLKRMLASYEFLYTEFDFSPIPKGTRIETMPYDNFKAKFDGRNPQAIIVDVDGTLADNSHRSPFAWDLVKYDRPKNDVINIVNTLSADYNIIIFTGRDGCCKEDTKQWLRDNNVTFDAFYIREEGDIRKDSIIKFELFKENIDGHYDVVGVIDDRQQVVDMWRQIGLTCLQVDYGNF